jgi:hypothetical protein
MQTSGQLRAVEHDFRGPVSTDAETVAATDEESNETDSLANHDFIFSHSAGAAEPTWGYRGSGNEHSSVSPCRYP